MGTKISELTETGSAPTEAMFVIEYEDDNYKIAAEALGAFAPYTADSDGLDVRESNQTAWSGTLSLTPPDGKKFAIISCTLDVDASGSGGNWFLVLGANMDTDLPVGTYIPGTGVAYNASQLLAISAYQAVEISIATLVELNSVNTALRYVYVGGGGTASIPWRVLIHTGPTGTGYVTLSVVGWA